MLPSPRTCSVAGRFSRRPRRGRARARRWCPTSQIPARPPLPAAPGSRRASWTSGCPSDPAAPAHLAARAQLPAGYWTSDAPALLRRWDEHLERSSARPEMRGKVRSLRRPSILPAARLRDARAPRKRGQATRTPRCTPGTEGGPGGRRPRCSRCQDGQPRRGRASCRIREDPAAASRSRAHPASSSLKPGSWRIGSRSESPSRNVRVRSESSIARRRCAMAWSFWPARLSQQATL